MPPSSIGQAVHIYAHVVSRLSQSPLPQVDSLPNKKKTPPARWGKQK